MIRDTRTGEERFEGLVLADMLHGHGTWNDGYDWGWDALVWNAWTGRPERVPRGSTMGGCEDFVVTVDATPEVWDLAEAHNAREWRRGDLARLIREAEVLSRGAEVLVERGRKVPKGTTGRVFWLGESAYGRRVGLETADGRRLFTAAGNVRVLPTPETERLRAEWAALA